MTTIHAFTRTTVRITAPLASESHVLWRGYRPGSLKGRLCSISMNLIQLSVWLGDDGGEANCCHESDLTRRRLIAPRPRRPRPIKPRVVGSGTGGT